MEMETEEGEEEEEGGQEQLPDVKCRHLSIAERRNGQGCSKVGRKKNTIKIRGKKEFKKVEAQLRGRRSGSCRRDHCQQMPKPTNSLNCV